MRILFVCTGNICRSPMGELLLPRFLPDPGITSDSAGTRGLPQHPIDPNSAKLMSYANIDSSSFRSKRITPQIAADADLILCFEQHHIRDVATVLPQAARYTFLLTDFANLCGYCAQQGMLAGTTRAQKLVAAINNASLVRPMLPDPMTIPDPYRKDLTAFVQAHNAICQSLDLIARATAASVPEDHPTD